MQLEDRNTAPAAALLRVELLWPAENRPPGEADTQQIYSYCFYRNRGLVGVETIIIPFGYTAVIREVTCYAHITPGSNEPIFIEDQGTGAALIFFANGETSGVNYTTWSGRIVIGAGVEGVHQGFIINVPGPGAADISVNGYLLVGQCPVQIVGAPAP